MSEQYVWILSQGNNFHGFTIVDVFKNVELGKKEFYKLVSKKEIDLRHRGSIWKINIIVEEPEHEAFIGNDHVKLTKWEAK